MHYLIDNEKKIIFGWSAKCGCSHIKNIFYFLQNDKTDNLIHTNKDYNNTLPNDIEKYTTIIICRNPYKRIVSGFLDKYRIGGEFRHLWKYNTVTFSKFVYELEKNNYRMVEKHHFTPQTSENFNIKMLKSKSIKFYDIENIDYNYIENLYNKKIPEEVLKKNFGNERGKYTTTIDKYVYDLPMIMYYNSNVNFKYFYNENLRNRILKFYKNDFAFFYNLGIDYIHTEF
jgi:hypothetical protein